ncbi:uncharacterized protein B4U80_08132, partial [Leptotrombidium deliense]
YDYGEPLFLTPFIDSGELESLHLSVSSYDYGEPLFLTPFIDSGELEYARRLSQVFDQRFECGEESYSGYFTVNKTFNSNLFFWFFKSQNANAPVMLWLDGGPGTSSMYGLFMQNGPFVVKDDLSIECRDYTWTNAFSMLYIDQPVGAGFSFTEHENGFSKDIHESTENLYNALIQFFTLFEELQHNEFYAVGYSYGGKYIPAIAQKIHTELNPIINFKGIAVGNGFFDPPKILALGPLLYQLSLIDENLKKEFDEKEKEVQQLVDAEMYEDAFVAFDNVIFNGLITKPTLFNNATGYKYYYDFILTVDPISTKSMVSLLNIPSVHKALHVGSSSFVVGDINNIAVMTAFKNDFMRPYKDTIVDVLNNCYKVLFYGGNRDIIIAPVVTSQFLKDLEGWNDREEYLNSEHEIWRLESNDDDVAGYIKRARMFKYVVVRNAGHIVPFSQPEVIMSNDEIAMSPSVDDFGEALFLTPLIESGDLEKGKQLSRVCDKHFECGGESYSGYLTVNQTFNSNLFFWFFKSQDEHAPVLLWVDGGPGLSAMFGLFLLNGPFVVIDDLNIECREFSWTKAFSMLYIDQPVGTGFSFTEHDDGYSTNIGESTENLYNALTQFFTLFEELQYKDFYLAGYSYAAKYIPAIALKIRSSRSKIINLKGIAIGNGLFDPSFFPYGTVFYHLSLIDDNLRLKFEEMEIELQRLIDEEMFADAFSLNERLIYGVSTGTTLFNNATGYKNIFDYVFTTDPTNTKPLVSFMNIKKMHKALHVGNNSFILGYLDNFRVITSFKNDFMRPYIDMVVQRHIDTNVMHHSIFEYVRCMEPSQ